MPTLLNGCAMDCGRPLFPADVKAALEGVPAPRCLVTTPLHLKALIASPVAYPPISLLMSATAPLSIDLAKQAESRLGARIFEIYGCTKSATWRPAGRRKVATGRCGTTCGCTPWAKGTR